MTTQNVSVLLPVFMQQTGPDRTALLRRAIQSVLVQDYPGCMELIIIDDGSPEPIETLIDGSSVPQPHSMRILRTEENRGLVAALNHGLAAARYELIGRIDSDDAWSLDKIKRQLETMRDDPGVTLAAGRGLWLFVDGQRPTLWQPQALDWSALLAFMETGGSPFPHGTILARTDVFRLLGGYPADPRCEHAEDFALWSLWLRFFKAHMDQQPLLAITPGSWSVSRRHSGEQARAAGHIMEQLRRLSLAETAPNALNELSNLLGISLLQAGALCFRLWRERPLISCPSNAKKYLETVLPDRRITAASPSEGGIHVTVAELVEEFGEPVPAMPESQCMLLRLA